MDALLEFGKAIVGPEPGVKMLLLVCLALVVFAFWKEKSKNDKVSDERLKEAREDTELLVDTVNEAVNTVREFKASNDALRLAFETLVKELHTGEGD